MSFDKDFWEARYRTQKLGWDIGHISTPLKEYIDQLEDKDIKILIPGAGNSYEGEYLFTTGFSNVFILDITQGALDNFKSRVPEFPQEQLILNDFFLLEDEFDLILEQTFFCALDPTLRHEYVSRSHKLLSNIGKIAGLLFKFPLSENGPPFGGSEKEYRKLLSDKFNIKVMEEAYNSIDPRSGNELFFIAQKKAS